MMKPLLLQMKLKRSRSRSPPQNQNCISLQTFLSKCFQMLDEKNTGTRVGLKTEIYYVSITINTLSGTQSLESRATCRRGPNNFIDDGYMYDPLECLSTQGSLPFPRLGQVNVDYDKDVKELKIYVYYPRSDEKTIPRYDRTIFTGDGFDYFKFVPSLRTRNKIISQNFYPFSTDKNAFKLFTKSQESKLTAADKNKLSTFTVDPAYEGYSYYCVEGGVHTLYLLWHLDEEWKISVK